MSDRSNNRAHPFGRESGAAEMLDLPQVNVLFEHIEQLLKDLRLLCNRSTRRYHDVYSCGSGSGVNDLVDLVLCRNVGRMRHLWGVARSGNPEMTDKRWWRQYRAAYYARIHDAFDAGSDDAGSPLFNDPPAKHDK